MFSVRRLHFFGYFRQSHNDDPSVSISIWGRDKNHSGLGRGCREVVEVWGFVFWTKTLELTARYAMARYHDATPNHLQCRFGLAGPVFEVFAVFLSKPDSSAIILTLSRRSLAITARTTSTFSSFLDEVGLPERGSSPKFSRPSVKALCHLTTIFLDRVASP